MQTRYQDTPMNKIKQYRELAKLTQAQIAARLGVVPMAVSKYENGHTDPDLHQSREIVAMFNECSIDCTLDDVFPPKEPEQPASPTTNEAA